MRISRKTARVTLCSMEDTAETGGVMRLKRGGIYEAWAEICPKRGQLYGKSGYYETGAPAQTSHVITMTYRPDALITDAAWIYHPRRKSAPEWFRIMRVMQDGADFVFSCLLHEQSDRAQKPAPPAPENAGRPLFAPFKGAAETEI